MSQPAIVLVHGFWGGAAHWAKVIVELDRRGYGSLHAVENPLTSLADDSHRTQQMIKEIDPPSFYTKEQGFAALFMVGHVMNGDIRRLSI